MSEESAMVVILPDSTWDAISLEAVRRGVSIGVVIQDAWSIYMSGRAA